MLTDTISKVCVTVIIVATLIVIGALAWHGVLTGSQVLGALGTIIGLPGLLFAGHSIANASANATAFRMAVYTPPVNSSYSMQAATKSVEA